MTTIRGDTQTKSSREKDKDYSMKYVQDTCIIEYKGKIKEREDFKWVPFIDTFGADAVEITGILEVLLGIVIIFICFGIINRIDTDIPAYMGHTKDICIIISFTLIFAGSLVLFCHGMSLYSNVNYIKATRCKKCGRELAYEEREEPDIKEVSTEESYIVTIIRYWKCRYCGHIDSREGSEDIETRKGIKKRPIEITCEKCGKTEISPECRDPDIKREDLPGRGITTTIRYYRCEYCGHLNIEVEKKDTIHGDQPTVSECKGKDPRL